MQVSDKAKTQAISSQSRSSRFPCRRSIDIGQRPPICIPKSILLLLINFSSRLSSRIDPRSTTRRNDNNKRLLLQTKDSNHVSCAFIAFLQTNAHLEGSRVTYNSTHVSTHYRTTVCRPAQLWVKPQRFVTGFEWTHNRTVPQLRMILDLNHRVYHRFLIS